MQRAMADISAILVIFQERWIPYNSIEILISIIKMLLYEKSLRFLLLCSGYAKEIDAIRKFTTLRHFMDFRENFSLKCRGEQDMIEP